MFRSVVYVLILMACMILAMDIYVKIVYIDNDPEVTIDHNYNMCSVNSLTALKSYNILSMFLTAIPILIFLLALTCWFRHDDLSIVVIVPTIVTVVIHIIAGITYMAMNRKNHDLNNTYKCYTKAAEVHYEYMCYKIPIVFGVPWLCIILNAIVINIYEKFKKRMKTRICVIEFKDIDWNENISPNYYTYNYPQQV